MSKSKPSPAEQLTAALDRLADPSRALREVPIPEDAPALLELWSVLVDAQLVVAFPTPSDLQMARSLVIGRFGHANGEVVGGLIRRLYEAIPAAVLRQTPADRTVLVPSELGSPVTLPGAFERVPNGMPVFALRGLPGGHALRAYLAETETPVEDFEFQAGGMPTSFGGVVALGQRLPTWTRFAEVARHTRELSLGIVSRREQVAAEESAKRKAEELAALRDPRQVGKLLEDLRGQVAALAASSSASVAVA